MLNTGALEDGPIHSTMSLSWKENDGGALSVPVDAFGDETDADVKYKTLTWWQCGTLMIAESISLGVLSLPAAVATLGLLPAVVLIVAVGIISTYAGYILAQFKWRYPQVSNMADVGEVLLGSFGRELLTIAQTLFLIFLMGSHLLTFTVALNQISSYATCSMVFGIVGLVVSFICSLPRTLANISLLSFLSFISIVSAVFITLINVVITNPGTGRAVTTETNFYHAFAAVTNIIFSFSGHIGFFGFMAELRDPHDFPKALYMVQVMEVVIYIVAGVVIYIYAGDDVASPALGSASPIVSKIAYGVAIPAILTGGVVVGHIAAKLIYMRLLRMTGRMHARDFLSVGTWVGIMLSLWTLAWIIAEAIPVFSNMLTLICALFASWFSYGLCGLCWLFINQGRYLESWKKLLLTIINITLIGRV
ncbi:transmembrane amino acid transporter protein-domain-containing protein [Aspergillus alliaceus]|uniref:transmembrane amino acid transporter protein-domain-containing protein n=1 Tax=Petromyces alliaceus TaxID=209559 RepID=UPI0012A4F4F7|nr:transmembrane amino acid transporter protein-domain-containing protein [Aspergillus alliaceus]KAB8228059.1 transmembrane amino acid transporter protein-domain-containing protein [Aspergillus alliaceus]